MVAKLQLALDLIELERAIEIAKKAADYVDFIEAGTPLIKSEGVKCIKALKQLFPNKIVVADMKTMDTGYLEARIAARAGADIVSILAAATDKTIEGALQARKDHGIEVMVDLIGVGNKLERARELEKMKIDYLVVHTGIDEQRAGKSPFQDLKEISKEVSVKLAVAGGIRPENIPLLEGCRVDVVIVGGFITKSPNPREAAKQMRDALTKLSR
ncbi:MAG TPA: 3-hexulose-6-phosphate synthase [Candidatus Korarchaeota archaeon]|nr:3-hexulose-6-phosphate synthase [Candidatus Korarchaeota archaeon]